MIEIPSVVRSTEIHTTKELYKDRNGVNQWKPAKPCRITGFALLRRIKLSWYVFIGKCDCFYWD